MFFISLPLIFIYITCLRVRMQLKPPTTPVVLVLVYLYVKKKKISKNLVIRGTLSPVFSMHTVLTIHGQNNVLQNWRNWIFKQHPQFCLFPFFKHWHDIHVLTFSSAAGRHASSSVCILDSEPVWDAVLHSGLWRYYCSR